MDYCCARLGCPHRDRLLVPVMVGYNRRIPPDIIRYRTPDFRIPLCKECIPEFQLADACSVCNTPTYDNCDVIGTYHVCAICVGKISDYVRETRAHDPTILPCFRWWIDQLSYGYANCGPCPIDGTQIVAAYLDSSARTCTDYEMRCISARARMRALGCPDELGRRVIRCLGPENVVSDWATITHLLLKKIND